MQFERFVDSASEEKFKYGQKVIGEIRSAKAKYDIPHKSKIERKFISFFFFIEGILKMFKSFS